MKNLTKNLTSSLMGDPLISTIRICLVGARPDTVNLGCSALSACAIAGIFQRIPHAQLTVFDLGRGLRKETYTVGRHLLNYMLWGAVNTRRFYRRESFWNMRFSSWFGGLGNPGVHAIAHATAVLDISSGDSFSDLYGVRRFNDNSLPKLITLQQRRPLILLPQTYGPFNNPRCRRIAKKIVCNATAAWSRDDRNFSTLCELLDDKFDPARHHSGVDLAFALPMSKPREPLPKQLLYWLEVDSQHPIIGFNISGLIYDDPIGAIRTYGFRADYCEIVIEFLKKIIQASDANILLIPHVEGEKKADRNASFDVAQKLKAIAEDRLILLPPGYDQSEIKWIISRCDWFCGTRMHSTIAGLSSGVPTASIAYSLKTQGVFETCDQGDHVVDPRQLSTDDVLRSLLRLFQQREVTRRHLSKILPDVKKRVKLQMDHIVATSLGDTLPDKFTEVL